MGPCQNPKQIRLTDIAGQDEEIIVGQTAMLGGVHELMEIKAILGLVLVEHIKSLGVVKELGSTVESSSSHFVCLGEDFSSSGCFWMGGKRRGEGGLRLKSEQSNYLKRDSVFFSEIRTFKNDEREQDSRLDC